MINNGCPLCAGISGVYVTYKQTRDQQFYWNGENMGATDPEGSVPRTVRCLDCRQPVTRYVKNIRPFNIYNRITMDRVYDMGDSILGN